MVNGSVSFVLAGGRLGREARRRKHTTTVLLSLRIRTERRREALLAFEMHHGRQVKGTDRTGWRSPFLSNSTHFQWGAPGGRRRTLFLSLSGLEWNKSTWIFEPLDWSLFFSLFFSSKKKQQNRKSVKRERERESCSRSLLFLILYVLLNTPTEHPSPSQQPKRQKPASIKETGKTNRSKKKKKKKKRNEHKVFKILQNAWLALCEIPPPPYTHTLKFIPRKSRQTSVRKIQHGTPTNIAAIVIYI